MRQRSAAARAAAACARAVARGAVPSRAAEDAVLSFVLLALRGRPGAATEELRRADRARLAAQQEVAAQVHAFTARGGSWAEVAAALHTSERRARLVYATRLAQRGR